jgi:hypothetical protein
MGFSINLTWPSWRGKFSIWVRVAGGCLEYKNWNFFECRLLTKRNTIGVYNKK